MRAIRFLYILLLVFLSSCNNCKTWGDFKLGDKFSLMAGDGDDQTILIYCTSDSKCCYAGIELVPSNVSHIAADQKWIIAKTEEGKSNGYWIIDKELKEELIIDSNYVDALKSQVTGPLDSLFFYKSIKNKNINLELTKFSWR